MPKLVTATQTNQRPLTTASQKSDAPSHGSKDTTERPMPEPKVKRTRLSAMLSTVGVGPSGRTDVRLRF